MTWIRLCNLPPRQGGKPSPNTAPMSPSTGFVRIPSWRHNAASFTKRDTSRYWMSESEELQQTKQTRWLLETERRDDIANTNHSLTRREGHWVCIFWELLQHRNSHSCLFFLCHRWNSPFPIYDLKIKTLWAHKKKAIKHCHVLIALFKAPF